MRYKFILDGCSINDIDEGGSYDYYGYTHADGSWVIMRADSTGAEYRYAVGKNNYSTNWTNRATRSYKKAYEWGY